MLPQRWGFQLHCWVHLRRGWAGLCGCWALHCTALLLQVNGMELCLRCCTCHRR
jgi:hypothetical protein